MKNPSAVQSRWSTAPARALALILACAAISGCVSLAYEKEQFASEHVRVVHSERHCNEVDQSATPPFPNADSVGSMDIGLGRFVATRTAWEVLARQLAIERDGDLSLIMPCDGEGRALEVARIGVWRTRGFDPVVQNDDLPESGTLMAPPRTTYGARLQNIFDCLEQARVTRGPITSEKRQRLGSIDATEFFSPGPYFTGYARIDRNFRPTRTGELSLSMIHFDRAKADWAAGIYQSLSPKEKTPFAERYLACLLDRGYGWRPVVGSNKALQPTQEPRG